ncbi:hypothetical protein L3Y34_015370 [Caenorhabditis briggsae]|uniref:S1 motif domain-containing protein n=2 Tax=Caenorhabditis briggsae TaxID=6238 RepID=A0AAE9DU05_CAEBR|nr:hypothetical protein L3Y34_015370 [Caenorhabditis briggsae]
MNAMKRAALIEKEWILNKPIEDFVLKEVRELTFNRARGLIALFKEGCETAYIARYREDVHGGLSPEKIRKAKDTYLAAVHLNSKVASSITTITGKLTGLDEKRAVTERLKGCDDMEEVSDITKEFAPGSRKTKANIARGLGLEGPALKVLNGEFVDFCSLITREMKTVRDVEENMKALVADLINKDEEVRKIALKIVKLQTNVRMTVTSKLTREVEKKIETEAVKKVRERYREVIGLTRTAYHIMSHTVSALNRGSEEGVIAWKVELNPSDVTKMHPFQKKTVHRNMQNFFQSAYFYSINTYTVPMLERGVKRFLSKSSEERSITVFGRNVEQMFSQKGVHSKYVIALDPGSIVKAAFLEPNGKVIDMDQFSFSFRAPTFDSRGIEILKNWAKQTMGKDIVVAVGNGSNTYGTQTAVSTMIQNEAFPKEIDVCFCVVPEHGASKYSCTDAAREEFGEDVDIKLISAVSIGRRLIDPMSEYVKIEPQHLGKGQYQLSINEKSLKGKLVDVVRDRVSLIGVDLNLASEALLRNICGLNSTTAAEIVKYRMQKGRFKSRAELKKVKGIGDVSFQQCSGFLTVSRPDELDQPAKKRFKTPDGVAGWSPLDTTTVHPDHYGIALKLISKLNLTVEQIVSGADISFTNLTPEEEEIIKLLRDKPDLKPPPVMMKKCRALKNLRVNEVFLGTVTNTTDFGVFVDIGVEKDGLVHISNYRKNNEQPKTKSSNNKNAPKSNTFVNKNDPEADFKNVPSVGDQIEVIIQGIKGDRISLVPIKEPKPQSSSFASGSR